ncbi:MAG: hypothetical protein FJ267_04710, partial [Planctomycetes bacterium]|nr:hypothetical protein [Planctomycetota bacterium]
GLHWRWPWPLERITRERVDRIRSLGVGFRHSENEIGPRGSNRSAATLLTKSTLSAADKKLVTERVVEWTSTHGDHDAQGMLAESLMLTAEEVPVELTAEVQYRIQDLVQFTFSGSKRPEDVVRAIAESVLRDRVATATLDDVLTDRRAELERICRADLKEQTRQYKLGVEILDLRWLDVHPPKAVVPAYRQVADAMEDRELLNNEADAYADRILLGAIGEKGLRLLKQRATTENQMTKSDSSNGPNDVRSSTNDPAVVSSLEGKTLNPSNLTTDIRVNRRPEWTLDEEMWKQFLLTGSTGEPFLSGTLAAVLNEAHVDAERRTASSLASAARFEQMLNEYQRLPNLTSSKLYWDTVIETLSKRKLTIIDPKVAGKQQLWLGDLPTVPNLPLTPLAPQ